MHQKVVSELGYVSRQHFTLPQNIHQAFRFLEMNVRHCGHLYGAVFLVTVLLAVVFRPWLLVAVLASAAVPFVHTLARRFWKSYRIQTHGTIVAMRIIMLTVFIVTSVVLRCFEGVSAALLLSSAIIFAHGIFFTLPPVDVPVFKQPLHHSRHLDNDPGVLPIWQMNRIH